MILQETLKMKSIKYPLLKTVLFIGVLITTLCSDGIMSSAQAQEPSWLQSVTGFFKSEEKVSSSPATIAVLSHTDFLPDATAVYDKRSSMVGLPEVFSQVAKKLWPLPIPATLRSVHRVQAQSVLPGAGSRRSPTFGRLVHCL